jgi:16S rRNA (guanine966-N2)-methyltransferase
VSCRSDAHALGYDSSMRTKAQRGSPGARNAVRIIGGAWRGRRVHFPDSPDLRPTPDRVRETLFNWLQHDIQGTRCLDLFAGSGALGLEALSRGAREVIFIERAAEAVSMLRTELGRLAAGGRAEVLQIDARAYLTRPTVPFDGVFLDPPFGEDALAEYVRLLDAGGWVREGGWAYLESARNRGAPAVPARWQLCKSKYAGEVGYHLARIRARGDHE